MAAITLAEQLGGLFDACNADPSLADISFAFLNDTRRIHCHKALLYVRSSSVFRLRYLDHAGQTVTVSDLDYIVFYNMVRFFYTDNLKHVAVGPEAERLFKVASNMDMHTLAERVINVLGGGFVLGGALARSLENLLRMVNESDTLAEISTDTNIKPLSVSIAVNCIQPDIRLAVEDRVFAAHKFILSCRSTYFAAMLKPQAHWIESGTQQPVVLHDIAVEPFVHLLLFLYSGRWTASDDLLIAMLQLSDMMGVPDLAEMTQSMITSRLCNNWKPVTNVICQNIFETLEVADQLGLQNLKQSALNCIVLHLQQFVSLDRFVETPASLLTELQDLIKQHHLDNGSFKSAFQSIDVLQQCLSRIQNKPSVASLKTVLGIIIENIWEWTLSPDGFTTCCNKLHALDQCSFELTSAVVAEWVKQVNASVNLQNCVDRFQALPDKKYLNENQDSEEEPKLPLDQLEVSLLAFIRHRAFELAQQPSFDRLDAQLKQLLLKDLGLEGEPSRKVTSSEGRSVSKKTVPAVVASSPYRPEIGDQVLVANRGSELCTVRFVGTTSFRRGVWVGLELPNANGLNDGSVDGVRYFHVLPNRGLFVRIDQIRHSSDHR